ncbi:MarR family winged helix-turn-helix transcriptional regulator [Agromyces italicus]|uniref:MarR family winged helix-turn-helix transcriptional regulator n=1 Tax=Agromyces italicus TaxID=279572 RepID=UPI0004291F8F|nr:MarR family transcriptional regulator [Agromyces italicus]
MTGARGGRAGTAVESRRAQASAVLEAVTVLGRAIAAERRTPFEGRSLTRSQMQTLFLLAHGTGPITPSLVAEHLALTGGAVTQLVDGLKADGLIETARHPDDARSRVLRLTDAASSQVDRFEAETVTRLLPMFDRLDDDGLTRLALLLRTVTEEDER